MALKKLKLKLKNDLKKTIESNNKKQDLRFLNYFDLKAEGKLTVLLLPDVNGELWKEYKMHGPNLKAKGAGNIRCIYEATGETCDACQMGYDHLNLHKETGEKEYKDIAKQWFSRDYTIMSCLVLDSPIEVNESSDGNEVKLIYVPFAMKEKIIQAIKEGEIDEDDLFSTPFIIKKTENQGGYASYEHSYFRRAQATEDELSYFDDKEVEQYDYETLDAIPDVPTAEEVRAWVKKAAEKMNTEIEEEEEDRPKQTRRKQEEEREEEEEEGRYKRSDKEESEEKEEPERKKETKSSAGGLRDRLKNLK